VSSFWQLLIDIFFPPVCGSRAAVNTAVSKDDMRKRYSLLAERMQEESNLV